MISLHQPAGKLQSGDNPCRARKIKAAKAKNTAGVHRFIPALLLFVAVSTPQTK